MGAVSQPPDRGGRPSSAELHVISKRTGPTSRMLREMTEGRGKAGFLPSDTTSTEEPSMYMIQQAVADAIHAERQTRAARAETAHLARVRSLKRSSRRMS